MNSPRRQSSTIARRLAIALATGTCAFALTVPLAPPAAAQESAASLRGSVNGGATQVTAVEVNTGINRTVAVDSSGNYNFASLRPGTYRLEITTPNGVRRTDEFTLNVAQTAVFDIDVNDVAAPPADAGAEAPAGNEIIVTGTRIRTLEGGEVGANITQREIKELPQNNRNFLSFADTAPGVAVENPNGQSRIQGGAQNSRTVNVFIDGVGQKDYVLKNGITGQDSSEGNPFPQLAVGEYRVISSNYKAEFDQVSSVAITAATKSGTNEFHGEAFIDYTSEKLRDPTPNEERTGIKAKSKDYQFGGALGGPIIPDIAHFFITYEGKRRDLPREIRPGGGFPVSFFPSQYQGEFGPTNATFNEDLYFAKIDVSPSASDLIELSGKYRKESGEFLSSGSNARSTISSQDVREKRGLLRWEHTSDSFINDLKLTYEDVHWAPTPLVFGNGYVFNYAGPNPGNPAGPVFRADNILRVGGGANYQDKGQKGYGIQDDLTWTAIDNHTIKVGVKAKWVELNSLQLNNFNPVYTYNVAYPNPAGFNDTVPYRVQFGYDTGKGDPVVTSKNFQFGIYAQDDWDVTDRLTLNLGIRWDYERTPAFLDFVTPADAVAAVSPANYPNLVNANYDINDFISTGNNRKAFTGAFQPRVGFSYALDDARRFVLFGGYGRSYDRNQFDFLQQEISVGSFTTRTFNFNTGDPNNTCAPSSTCVPFNPVYLTQAGRDQLVAGAGAGGGRELRFIDNDLKVPYSDQFSLGVRGDVSELWNAEVGYTHIVSKDGFAYLLGNRRPDGSFFAPLPAAPSSPFGFAPPGFGSIIIGTNGLQTRADTGYVKLTKRWTQASPWNIVATYTYTEAEENRNFGEVFSLDYPSLEDYPFTRSNGVRKHRLVIAGAVDLPIAATISGKLVMASPPFIKSFFTNSDGLRDVVANEADANGDRWGFRQMDVAVTKYVPFRFLSDASRLRLRVDILNLFNDRNYVDYFGNPNDPRYLQINGIGTGTNPPRTIKFSAGFEF